MPTVTSRYAIRDATTACLNYLAQTAGFVAGKTALIGDRVPLMTEGAFVFMISGDNRDQVQAFGIPRPVRKWIANAFAVGAFNDWDQAYTFADSIVDALPWEENGVKGGPPNVDNLEQLHVPEFASFDIPTKNGDTIYKVRVTVEMRVVFNLTTV